MATKYFECDHCEARGKIIMKDDTRLEDIVCCPVCGGDIFEEEDFSENE
jgi:excinuclease UvrABC ATPase subunit